MSTGNGSHRKRGVRASRIKLAHALTEAGLKTQVALAERIADIEDLESVPKDAVNRVFRELPVDPITIERVARALGVEAHTLYLSSDEEEPVFDASAASPRRPSRGAYGLAAAMLALVIALSIRAWFAAESPPPDSQADAASASPSALSLGTPSLAVIPFDDDMDDAFAAALREQLADHFNVALPTAAVLTRSHDPVEVATLLRTDVVIDGHFTQVGRLSAVRVYLYKGGVRQQVWSDSVPTAALADALPVFAEQTALAVRRAFGMPVPGADAGHFALAPVQDDYLDGEYFLDQPSSELNIKRARSHFESALRKDANYARAHAGLCQALLEEHWMGSEERALNDASLACGQAVQLAPGDRVVASAHAHFLRRTGRNDEAIALYEQTVERHPKDAIALDGLATSRLFAYRESGDRAMLVMAKVAAQEAAAVDPYVWKPLFALATMEWFDGDVSAAIGASEAALARNENEYVLANLGSFYLCDGALEQARDAYARARDLNPLSYVGDEFLGQAHYFLGDFERSAALRQKAIDSVATGDPEIHEMWGNLADAYRQTGDRDKAIEAYVHAAEIAERDHLRGNMPVGDRAARAYYYTMLAALDPAAVPDSVLGNIDDEIDEIAAALVSASSLRRMAQTYLQREEIDKAREALGRATQTCKGYALLPDLAALR